MPLTPRAARLPVGIAVCVLFPALAGCTSNSPDKAGATATGDKQTISVSSTADACKASAQTAPSGNLTFSVTNAGTQVTEFYLYAEDGKRILGEVENVGPGLSRDLVVATPAGVYKIACKPGMTGSGIRSSFIVTDSGKEVGPTGATKTQLATAATQYQAYVKDQSDQLLEGTKNFAKAFTAGDEKEARRLYAPTRLHWERIEPVAESFGDLDPKLDLREADLEPGQKWTGWHRAEKDLWPPKTGYKKMTKPERTVLADQMVLDTKTLVAKTRTLKLTPDQISNGAKSLLDEVATGKVTGEEEIWSHTDLWDFKANVEGAEVAYKNVRPVLAKKNPALTKDLDTKFGALNTELAKHKKGDGYVLYTTLSKSEVKVLSRKVDALGEPLSKLTAAILS